MTGNGLPGWKSAVSRQKSIVGKDKRLDEYGFRAVIPEAPNSFPKKRKVLVKTKKGLTLTPYGVHVKRKIDGGV